MGLKNKLRESLLKLCEGDDKVWYHGTPDLKTLEKGFLEKSKKIEYIKDIEGYKKVQNELNKARVSGNEDLYFKLLDTVGNYKDFYNMKSPIFVTDVLSVANTYADASRSIDYQNAREGVLKVRVNVGNLLSIPAFGQRFRFISTEAVKRAFINGGMSEKEFDVLFFRFQFYTRDKSGIKTDVIGAMAQWVGYDTVDVKGVLDSYNGGSTKSIVRIIFNHKNIEIIK